MAARWGHSRAFGMRLLAHFQAEYRGDIRKKTNKNRNGCVWMVVDGVDGFAVGYLGVQYFR